MFNVTIIKLKDLIKYLLSLIIILIIIYIFKRYFFYNKNFEFNNINFSEKISNMINNNILRSINNEATIIGRINDRNKEIDKNTLIDENEDSADEEFMTQVFTSMIGMELGVANSKIKEKESDTVNLSDQNNDKIDESETIKTEQKNINNNTEKKESLEIAKESIETKVVTENPIKEVYTKEYRGVKIKNETNYELTNNILDTEDLNISSKNIIIFHTHTCESYTSSEKYSYNPTGNFRTTDLNYSVARVGDELTKYLEYYKFNVIHNKTYHDYPSYNGSYNRSLTTITNLLKKNSADIIIDLHRDAIGSNSKYAPTVKIGDDYCAQIMFVMGTNGGGLYHPNWQTNLKFAIKVQENANNMYAGLFKPIIIRNSRYNQHLGKAACIIEVGSTGNTLEQCLNSMKYLSNVFNKTFN